MSNLELMAEDWAFMMNGYVWNERAEAIKAAYLARMAPSSK